MASAGFIYLLAWKELSFELSDTKAEPFLVKRVQMFNLFYGIMERVIRKSLYA